MKAKFALIGVSLPERAFTTGVGMKSKIQKQLTPDGEIHKQLQAQFEYGCAKRKEPKPSLLTKSTQTTPILVKKKS